MASGESGGGGGWLGSSFFLSGHLFHGFGPEVRRFARTPLAELQPGPQPQWIAGIVASQRTQMTRRGKKRKGSASDKG